MSKKVYLASDHAGFDLKEALMPFLKERGYEVEDLGPFTLETNDDYPDTIMPLALRIANEQTAKGIAIGASGQGEAMVCNRIHGVRAAVFYGGDSAILTLSREHNNANVLCLGARMQSQAAAKSSVELWLTTEFSNEERHARRIQKLN